MMKTVFVQADGLASAPLQELDGQTPLQAASTPNLDFLVSQGEFGHLLLPVEGKNFLSDMTHLALLGYDPSRYYSGPGPFEATSLEVVLDKQDVAFLCHLVTIRSNDEKNENKKLGSHFMMDDDQAGGIESEEARELIDAVNDQMASETIQFYTGKGHRHVMVWAGGMTRIACENPRAALGHSIEPFLPTGEGSEILKELMEASRIVFRHHPVNRERQESGLKPANCLWLWGPGKAVDLPKMSDRWPMSGATISTVDLHLGIGICAGLEAINPENFDGFDSLDFRCYTKVCCRTLQTKDFVYIHVPILPFGEAKNGQEFVKVVEAFDDGLIGTLRKSLPEFRDYRLLVACSRPFHDTQARQVSPTPFVLYKTNEAKQTASPSPFNEVEAAKGNGRDATRIVERLFTSA